MKTQQVVETSATQDVATPARAASLTAQATTSSSTTTSTGGSWTMEDDTKLLKSLQVGAREGQGRGLRVCQVRKLQPQEEMTTLLDGCATRCLRQVRGEDEGQRSQPVKVATGAVQLKQRKETGTLLTMGPVQAIVPVSKMLQMGLQHGVDQG